MQYLRWLNGRGMPGPAVRGRRTNGRGKDTAHATQPAVFVSAHDAIWIQAATIFMAILGGSSATAQQPPAPAQQPTAAPPVTWESMPRMQIEQQFAGPLKDTLIQRLRDPQSNVLCYVYLPFTAAHSQPTANSYVQYGSNSIGSISCVEPAKPQPPAAPAAPRPASPAPKRNSPPASSEPARP